MAHGLEVFGGNGVKTLSHTDLMLRYTTIKNPWGTSGNFSAPGCTSYNSYVYLVSTKGSTGTISEGSTWGPRISYSISNGVVSWSSNVDLEGETFFTIFKYR